MDSDNAFNKSRALIFDTGPLWELILYRTIEEGLRRGLKMQFLREEAHYDRLTSFVDMFPTKMTTAHVVAEISNHIKRDVNGRKEDVWRIVFEEFEGMRMNEHLVRLLDMRERIVEIDHDAVDSSILQLGMDLRKENPTVFTTDQTLVSRCINARVRAANIYEVISS